MYFIIIIFGYYHKCYRFLLSFSLFFIFVENLTSSYKSVGHKMISIILVYSQTVSYWTMHVYMTVMKKNSEVTKWSGWIRSAQYLIQIHSMMDHISPVSSMSLVGFMYGLCLAILVFIDRVMPHWCHTVLYSKHLSIAPFIPSTVLLRTRLNNFRRLIMGTVH